MSFIKSDLSVIVEDIEDVETGREEYVEFDCDVEDIKLVKDGKIVKYTDSEKLQAKIARDKADRLGILQRLCDEKTADAIKLIGGANTSSEQVSRYAEKLEMAVAFKADGSYKEQLSLEAEFKGIKVDALADLIIKMGAAYKNGLTTFNARIEAFRIRVSALINEGEFPTADLIMAKAEGFNAKTTDKDIKALFDEIKE